MDTFANKGYGIEGKQLYTLLAWVYILCGIGVLAAPSAGAEPTFRGDIELLRTLAKAQRDNAGRISSWQGSSRVEIFRSDPNGILLRDASTYHFIYAREYNATRWDWTPEERYGRDGGKLVADPLPDKELKEMRKGDAFYRYNLGILTREGERRGTLVILPVDKAEEGVYSYSFDPMWYLTGKVTGWDDMAKGLMRYYRKANEPNLTSPFARYTLKRGGSLVTFEIENQTAEMTSRFVFDPFKGGTLAKYHGTWKKSVQTMEWTYEQKDGIWIPKTWMRTMEKNPPAFDGCTKYGRTVTFDENILNRPVSASEFSLEKLGLKV